jgi:hypothetical protein
MPFDRFRSAAPEPLFGTSSGPGALCFEAQADGVPCATLGVDCHVCGRRAPDAVTGTAAASGATGCSKGAEPLA